MEELLVRLGGLGGLVDAALHHLHIGHDELNVDDADIPYRVGGALHMDHVLVVKAAHHVDDGIGLPDVGQELVAQTLSPAGALHQTGDVHELDDRRGGLFGLVEIGQPVQTVIGHSHHAHVGIDGTEGVVGALGAGVGDGVEQGRLAHVGKAHNAELHIKDVLSV